MPFWAQGQTALRAKWSGAAGPGLECLPGFAAWGLSCSLQVRRLFSGVQLRALSKNDTKSYAKQPDSRVSRAKTFCI